MVSFYWISSRVFKPADLIRFLVVLTLIPSITLAQVNIALPYELREETKPQLSGIALHHNRLYLLPQFLSNSNPDLKGDLFLYSVSADTIQRVIDGTDPAIATCVPVRIKNADKLPQEIHDHYGGFEAIAITGEKVYLTIESKGTWSNNYLVCGKLNIKKREITINPKKVVTLKRFDQTDNAGFESLAYDAYNKKFTAIYEFNAAAQSSSAYEIGRRMRSARKVELPFAYFRITDITYSNDTLFALNYHWGGDYKSYLKDYHPENIRDSVPELKPMLDQDSLCLENPGKCFTRIMYRVPKSRTGWKTAVVVHEETSENNWEGLVRFRNGFLIVSDSNTKGRLITTLRYVQYAD
ncbi:MAG: hypothetical protein JNK79_17645 [Chitinophagaceae bacterium]|nr:hypothetical protein [Chitinophagaceae bacterium]